MTTLCLILGDQLTPSLPCLRNLDRARDVVLMMEVWEEAVYVRHHKQKIALIFSAMRHFAAELGAEGYTVDYVRLDDPANTGSFTGEVKRAAARHRPARVVVTEPGEWRVGAAMLDWQAAIGVPVAVEPDPRFFATHADFARWAAGRRTLRMEFFYREMRRTTGLLMEAGQPSGGQWNLDHDNRKRLPPGATPPRLRRFEPDDTTRAVIALVADRFGGHFGGLENFGWAVTRAQAHEALAHFIAASLPGFGDYQDAMKRGEPFLYHSVISPYLNIGLLTPREVCAAAETAWLQGAAPLNAVEGFIRQILGWREFVRGIYWLKMPGYAASNYLKAKRPLPWFYWSGETPMNCLATVVEETRSNAYAHHIQRLMVTGNFALLAGVRPAEIEAWYLAVYADAFDWVELPNTHGMAIFADGGLIGSKPYAASGAYINRMSDYCGRCAYDVKARSGPGSCPFNRLYWNFLIENEERLAGNPRMALPYRALHAMTPAQRTEIAREAKAFLDGLEKADVPAQLDLGL